MKKMNRTLLVIGIIFVAFNLRPALTSVGPLIGFIRTDLGISNGTAGFITTLPLLSFAIISVLAPRISRTYGNERTIFFGLFILFIGIIIRSLGYIPTVFLGTLLIGVGIAVGNVLLPSLVKLKFPDKVGIMTSTYTTALSTFAALGSGIIVPLAQGMSLGWKAALASWAVIAVIAMIIWFPQLRETSVRKPVENIPSGNKGLWSSALAWQVTFFIGLQSFLFYCTIAWLPAILESHGMSLTLAGWILSIMQLAGLPATFMTPVIAERFRHQKGIVLFLGILHLVGLFGLIYIGNTILLIAAVICIGVAQSASFSLALTFIGLRTTDAKQAANLSGMSQSIGYLLAAIGPSLIGYLFDQTHSWTIPLFVLAIINVMLTVAGIGAGRNQYVFREPLKKIS
ncbi:CynX/NimT family MFS transporter [Neobacillus rhizophilus]|uniref:MFS transporter n=1 Tax=Neobacillus rhizophilus TaxID=2833579 RepID=A0A942YTG7_9BACI|nr:MFS transporter [Neobacillus rhizophilus]MBS4210915.1 MFS transporter [Neobacillus rhizophilus]